jgi:hypothetical protein
MRSVLALVLIVVLPASTLAQSTAQTGRPNSSSGSAVTSPAPTQSAPVSAQPRQEDYAPAERLIVLWECDMNQCVTGGGGAIWVFEGNHGQALWHVGAVADLTMESFDNKRIAVHRSDPLDSYSTKFTGGKVFTAEYTGAIDGKNIKDGKVVFGGNLPATWYGGFTDGICDVGEACPLAPHQLVELGENSLNAKLYSAAFQSFKSAAGRGEYDGEAFAAIMLRDGAPGIAPKPAEALRMLKDSADHDNVNGERGLSEMYEFGIATPKDPQLAAFWKNKALERVRSMQAEAQAEANRRTGFAIGATVFGLLILGALVAGSSSSQSDESDSVTINRRQHAASDLLRQSCLYGDVASCVIGGFPNPNPNKW